MTVRLTLAALLVVPAVMAYPWQTVPHRWLLGVAVVAVIVLFARWRGRYVTTIVGRRLAILLRGGRIRDDSRSDEYVTVVLRLEPSDTAEPALTLVAGYLDRYGIRFDKVRVTSREADGTRITWVGLTLGAAGNIAALSARSAAIPLRDTAELAARRLADHLRETGWEVSVDDTAAVPLQDEAKERWRSVEDGRGYLAAYALVSDEPLDDMLSAVRDLDAVELWTAVEFTGDRTRPEFAAACAVRTAQRPGARAPLPGLSPQHGRHAAALAALAPASDQRLPGPTRPVPPVLSRT
ncbi:type VII secretion protein EccE [Mycobacterium sp. 4D054]|uniref:type VII secretion protein EccE n=1 Tax=unclassified Mycobacterium TaxID=2642494 RepID=UPI0021B32F5C|nr:type VII secretion protein EccE [Mycobacterium sp. SMC-8]UXA14028.1 type VII secretion protein EccE [Mycobacterium sp. SMC-8]